MKSNEEFDTAAKACINEDVRKLKNVLKISQYLADKNYVYDKDTNVFSNKSIYVIIDFCPYCIVDPNTTAISYEFGCIVNDNKLFKRLCVITPEMFKTNLPLLPFNQFVTEFEHFIGELSTITT